MAAVTITAGVLVFRYLRDDPGSRTDADAATGIETLRALLDQPMVRALVFFRASFSVGKMAVIVFLPIFARREFAINAFAIGWILAGGKLTKSLLQGRVGEWTDRVERKRYLVVAGALLYGVGAALVPAALYAEGAIDPVRFRAFGREQVLGGAFFTLFAAYGLLGVADSVRLPASMALFVEEGERLDSVASSMALRSISWKAGQVAGPALVGAVKQFVSTEASFLAAAGCIVVATVVFLVTHARAEARSTAQDRTAPGD
jgi:predicted MFS family arabinose efflux permease